MRMFMICVVVISVLTTIASASEADLQQQNHEYLNPQNDHQEEHSDKEHDKRTIFSSHHGWAKHVGVHPSGFKYVIGYSPVDLKYVPVVKPVGIRAHYHHRPKWHIKHPVVLRPFLPVRPVVHHDGWKPVVPLVKPVVPVHKPWHDQPWIKPVHIQPAVPVVKPVQPVVPIKPIHHVPIVPSKPLIPVAPPLVPIQPALPPFTVIHQVPTAPAHLHNPAVIGTYAPGTFIHQHLVPAPHPPPPPVVIPQVPPPAPPAIIPPQPVFPVHPHPPQHDVQTPHSHHVFEQELPHHVHQVFQQPQAPEIYQQLPHPVAPEVPVNPQLPENPSFLFHQQLPGNVQHLFNQQIQHGEGATSNILLQGAIQPGHTDLQLPVHLPQHPNYLPDEGRQFQPGNFHDPSQHPEALFRPSIQLEPPFSRRK